MANIEWNDSLNIGIPLIDDQHRELIDIVNEVLEAIEEHQDPKVISRILSKLREYTVLHFNDEEAFMKEIEYPQRREQQQQHKTLKQTVKDFQQAHFYQEGLGLDEIKKLLSSWLLTHILESDTDIARHYKTYQAPPRQEETKEEAPDSDDR